MNSQIAADTPHIPDPVDIHVGSQVRYQRTLRGWSQSDLADAIGVTFQQVQKYENGFNRLSPSRLVRIASVLDMQADVFFAGLDDGSKKSKKSSGLFNAMATSGDTSVLCRETLELVRCFNALEGEPKKMMKKLIKDLASYY